MKGGRGGANHKGGAKGGREAKYGGVRNGGGAKSKGGVRSEREAKVPVSEEKLAEIKTCVEVVRRRILALDREG